MSNDNLQDVEKLNFRPFTRFCMSIGAVPSSYLAGLTIEEQMLWLCSYLEKEVIPAVNGNAEAVEELQNLYVELHDYVEHYFDNLDVQEEINNKLDAMALDGTLANIINQEIFGQINEDLASLGERMTAAEGDIDGLETNVGNLNDSVSLLTSEKTLVVGDSYANGDNPNSDVLTTWPTILKNLLGIADTDFTVLAENGSGFCRAGDYNHTFLQLLQSEIGNITNKNLYTKVIVCGGYNDNTYTSTAIKTAIGSFVDYVKAQFVNATIYIGCIGYRNEISDSAATTRQNIASNVYSAYANNISSQLKGYVYLNGVENILKSLPKTYMYSNNAHPNQNGQNALGYGIYESLMTGVVKPYASGTFTLTNASATSISGSPAIKKSGDTCRIVNTGITIKYATGTMTLTAGQITTVGTYSTNSFIGGANSDYNVVPCVIGVQDYSIGRHTMPGYVIFGTDGNLKIWTWHTINTTSSGTSLNFSDVKEIDIYRFNLDIPFLFS